MNSVHREQVLDDDGLHTLMCEIESTLNNKPITMSSDNYNDLEPLTSNHIDDAKAILTSWTIEIF